MRPGASLLGQTRRDERLLGRHRRDPPRGVAIDLEPDGIGKGGTAARGHEDSERHRRR